MQKIRSAGTKKSCIHLYHFSYWTVFIIVSFRFVTETSMNTKRQINGNNPHFSSLNGMHSDVFSISLFFLSFFFLLNCFVFSNEIYLEMLAGVWSYFFTFSTATTASESLSVFWSRFRLLSELCSLTSSAPVNGATRPAARDDH